MKGILLALLTLFALTGCDYSEQALQAGVSSRAGASPPPNSWLDQVESACDQYGNRIYTVDRYNLAVVGQDPTCKGAPR